MTAPATPPTTPAAPAAPAAEKTVAQSVVQRLAGTGARQVMDRRSLNVAVMTAYLHAAAFSVGKMGKTHLGLAARSHAVYLPGKPKATGFGTEQGELVIPSKPLSIAYANFDRDATTVLLELPDDIEIVQEKFFKTPAGDQIYEYDMATVRDLERRLNLFMAESEHEVDLFIVDGGTVIWDAVKEVTLPAPAGVDADGQPHHLARQYGASNSEMHSKIMARLYALECNTWLTQEARAKWSKASGPETDAAGNDVMIPDGWSRTDHYCDLIGQVKLADVQAKRPATGTVKERWYQISTSTKPQLIGSTITEPTYAKLYAVTFPQVPLLRRDDRAAFAELQAKHGQLTWE